MIYKIVPPAEWQRAGARYGGNNVMTKHGLGQGNFRNFSCGIACAVMATACVLVSPANAQPIANVDDAAKCTVEVLRSLPNTLVADVVGRLTVDFAGTHNVDSYIHYVYGSHNSSEHFPFGNMSILVGPLESPEKGFGMSMWPGWPLPDGMTSFSSLKRDAKDNPLHDGFDLLEKKCNVTYSTPDIVVVR